MERLPNRIYPQRIRLKLSDMAEAFAKGRKLLSSQTYEIKNSVGEATCWQWSALDGQTGRGTGILDIVTVKGRGNGSKNASVG